MHFETKNQMTLLKELQVDVSQGLSTAEVASRQAIHGKNLLNQKKKKTFLGVFISQLNDPMIYILLVAGIISFILGFLEGEGEILDGIIIFAVVLLNATVGTIQEIRAENALEALKKLASPTAIVRREGKLVEVPAEDLVPGDIVILEEGRTIPADIRLIESINLKANESSLTGESVPVEKNAKLTFSDPVSIGDRLNMVYMSTPITYGRGEGVVVATGMNTEIGRIATLINQEKDEMTPLQKRLADLSKVLGVVTLVVVAVLFVVALFQGRDVIEMFITSISLAVAAVPEGLPAVVTVVLSIGVQRMVKVNTIVRRLPSVETLGSVSVVCSDKTGTLTQNKMTVVKAYTNHQIGDIYDFEGETLHELASGLSLCSNASVDQGVYGDPTEIALVEFANVFELRKAYLEKVFPRIDELPFDSVRKMMSTAHKVEDKVIVYTKGALDQMLKRTTRVKINGEIREITKEDLKQIQKGANEMAKSALRVLALAYHEGEGQIEEENLIFIGLVGMVDPPRPEAKGAVSRFKGAGIITVMITGDHQDTALSIAKELGIAQDESQCINGEQLSKMTQEELNLAVVNTRVFARVSPENKVMIVKAFKSHDHIVAMTGDGVNDAPSLKAADIGIAMGITGTDVAKGAAAMVLSDDNFASIEKAVEEGRNIYANIKKTVLFLLSSNFGEVITMMVAIIIGLPIPLAALHILWVNLITDSLPAIALGSDGKDPDIMKDRPRHSKESLFAHGGFRVTIGYGALIALMTLFAFVFIPVFQHDILSISGIAEFFKTNPLDLEHARTYAFTVLGVSQLFHMLGMANMRRSFVRLFHKDRWLLWTAFAVGLGLQILVTEVPFLTKAFDTTSLHFSEWLTLAALATLPLIVHEIIVLIRHLAKK